jgi:putative acetyltransferase
MPKPNFTLRDETPDDYAAISELTLQAFRPLNFPELTEHFVVEALRTAGALTISLVAEMDGRVIGHIAFSPITISDGTPGWYGLGPVSVLPEYQRQGIGKVLIAEGLARLQAIGAHGCCLVGHPEYYGKVGFIHPLGLSHEGVPQEAFFAIAFEGDYPQGMITFHEAFNAKSSPNA